ncbi:unnamed protein product [Ilex paraguariensis]|uniref:Uncharacterized protein n=1 Tax=Ilex paraguariensis TaxID=185542 RepID=A0ABC8V1Z5_9AQUA
MSGGEAKKRKKVVSRGSFGNAKLFVDKDAKKRMINRIVACNIHPRGHTAKIGYNTAQLLYAIAEREVIIDLPFYIFNHVREASTVKDGRPCLPFSILVFKILKHSGVEFQQNDNFIYPMNPMSMGTLNKNVGAILGVKRGKYVKLAAAVPQVVGSQAGTSQVGSDAGTSEGQQTVVVIWAVTKGARAEFGYIANQLGLNGCCTGLFLIWGFCIRNCLGVQELD